MTETDLIGAQITYNGRGRSNIDITKSLLDEWRNRDKRHIIDSMLAAEEYYMCRNTTIAQKRRDMPEVGENSTLSNAKIPSAFLRTNVVQKSDYALGKPFLISVESPLPETLDEAGNAIEDPNAKIYLDEWSSYLSPARRKTIKRIGKHGAINKGIGWAYVTIDSTGDLLLQHVDSEQLYPAWAGKEHTILDAIVRDYKVIQYINNNREEVNKVEFWNTEVVERHVDKGHGALSPDPDSPPQAAHMELPGIGITWGRVPFIAFKGNEDELPMLNIIRQQIDSYDRLQSKSTDALLDDIDPVLALEGYSPELGDLIKQRHIMQNSRIVAIGTGGKAYYVQANPDITAVQQKLELLRKDIMAFGQAIDSQDVKFGSNPSGVALRSMYQDLDVYINGLETEFSSFMQQLKYFFDIYLEFKGIGTAEQWSEYEVSVKFDRDMMVNSEADINETVLLASTGVSQYTQDLWNPAVETPEIENQRREQEANSALGGMSMERRLAELKEENERLTQDRENAENP